MNPRLELTDAESSFIYRELKSGCTSRFIAESFQKTFSKPMNHTKILNLAQEMRAEEKEVEAVFHPPEEPPPPIDDREQLAEALAALRRLRRRAVPDRTGDSDNTLAALRVVSVEIRALRFKIALDEKAAKEDTRQEEPLAAPSELSQEPPDANPSSSPAHPERAQGASRRTSNPSSNPSNDAFSGFSSDIRALEIKSTTTLPDGSQLEFQTTSPTPDQPSSETAGASAAGPEPESPEEAMARLDRQREEVYRQVEAILLGGRRPASE